MTDILIDYAPRSYFAAYHDREQRFACIVAHRRAGKTTACIHELQRSALTVPRERPRLAYIAPQLKQAKAVAWDILKGAALPLRGHGIEVNESELRVDYPNGGQVRLYGADNPDSLRGLYLDGVVKDEPAQINPTLWPEVIRPALSDRGGWATFIGTPKGRDAFYQVWRNAETAPDWYALKLPASRTKIISQAELDAARSIMSASQYAREYECSFDEPDISQFIPSDVVDAARHRKAIGTGPRVLGVDIAREGDDRNCALYRNGDLVDEEGITVWRNPDLMYTVGRIAELITLHQPQATFIDSGGVGGGVVDRLKQLQFKVIGINSGTSAHHEERFCNMRNEMWSLTRDWIKDRGSIPDRDDLADDLTAPLYEFDHRNRLKLEKKEDMKKRGLPSPDIGDALALTFARPVALEKMGALAVKWRNEAVAQADPLAGF